MLTIEMASITMLRGWVRAQRRALMSIGLTAVACVVACWTVFGHPGVASASFPGQNGKIAFEDSGQIAIINPNGSGLSSLGEGSRPAWSADGSRIAWVCSPCGSATLLGQLIAANADGSPYRPSPPFSGPGVVGNDPSWFPDNNTLSFEQGTSIATVAVIDPNGSGAPGTATILLAGGAGDSYSQPVVSPDGTQIALTDTLAPVGGRQQSVIAVIPASGGTPKRLTQPTPGTLDSSPDWNPNGSDLVFSRSAQGSAPVLEIITQEGGTPRPLPTNNNSWSNPKFSPDGNLITATGVLPSLDI